MRTPCDEADDTTFRAILGLVVLGVAIACANVASLPIDVSPFTPRLERTLIRSLFTAGFTLQLGTGTWLALALVLDIQRGMRLALIGWLASLALYLAPVPTLLQDPAAAPVPLAVVALVALIGWSLDSSLRERAA